MPLQVRRVHCASITGIPLQVQRVHMQAWLGNGTGARTYPGCAQRCHGLCCQRCSGCHDGHGQIRDGCGPAPCLPSSGLPPLQAETFVCLLQLPLIHFTHMAVLSNMCHDCGACVPCRSFVLAVPTDYKPRCNFHHEALRNTEQDNVTSARHHAASEKGACKVYRRPDVRLSCS